MFRGEAKRSKCYRRSHFAAASSSAIHPGNAQIQHRTSAPSENHRCHSRSLHHCHVMEGRLIPCLQWNEHNSHDRLQCCNLLRSVRSDRGTTADVHGRLVSSFSGDSEDTDRQRASTRVYRQGLRGQQTDRQLEEHSCRSIRDICIDKRENLQRPVKQFSITQKHRHKNS